MGFYENFIALCAETNHSPQSVIKEIGLSKNVLYSWKSGRTMPTQPNLYKLAEYFGVPVKYFENGQKNNPPVKVTSGLDATSVTLAQAVEALNKFNSAYFKLNDKNRAIADNLIEALLKIQDNE